MKKTEKRIISTLLALVMCVNCAAPALAEDATAAVMRLTKATGTVSVTNSRGKGVSTRDNMRLYSGYHVETQEASYAWIDLDDAKLTKLDAVSELEVRKNGKKLELLLNSGNLYFNVTEPLKNDEALNIRTSTMTTGIRGTSGWVRVVDQWHTQVYVLQGRVECSVTDPVTGQTKTTVLTGGEMAEFVVYEQEKSGDKCDIIRKRFTEDDPGGFILVELTPDKPHRDKIEEDSGLVFPDDPEEAEDRLKQDEEDTHEKLKPILDDYEDQDNEVSKDPVWEEEPEPEPDDSYVADVPSPTPVPPGPTPDVPPVIPGPLTFTVAGQVLEMVSGDPVAGATVTVQALTRTLTPLGSTTTDSGGNYSVNVELNEGESYQVTISGVGYVADVRGGLTAGTGSAPVNFEMVPTTWKWNYADSTLTIYGTGAMDNYAADSDVPWYDDRDNITTVVIKDGITSIGTWVFSYCANMTGVDIPIGVTEIGENAFLGCTGLTNIEIPESVTSVGRYAFFLCDKLASINIPVGTTSIGQSMFSGCESLTEITIPASVTSIGATAFAGCKNLRYVNFDPNSQLTVISQSAFTDCAALTSITIPESVTSIEFSAFYGCTALTSIVIPSGVTSIGTQTFYNCTSLTNVTIPANVTSIENGAFANCSALADVYYGGSDDQWTTLTVSIGGNNDPLTNAILHYNSTGPDDTP